MSRHPFLRPLPAACLALLLAAPAWAHEPDTKGAPAMSAEDKAMMDAWQKAGAVGAQHRQLAEHFAGS